MTDSPLRWLRHEMPVAQVTGGKVKPGVYRALALLGWVEVRKGVPTVGLQTAVLKGEKHVGAVTVGLPVTPKTELYVCCLLQAFGWDGRLWPYDDDGGWPATSETDRDQVAGLLAKVGLSSTMTFAPATDGDVAAVRLPVIKKSGPFPWPPEATGQTPVHLERLRQLVADPSVFKPTSRPFPAYDD